VVVGVRWVCRAVRLFVVGAVAIACVGGGRGSSAAALSVGLNVVSDMTYVIDGDAAVVRVSNALRFENTTPDDSARGGSATSHVDGYAVPVPVGVLNVQSVTSGGVVLATTVRMVESRDFALVDIVFDRGLG
jgi:hypothetical protein